MSMREAFKKYYESCKTRIAYHGGTCNKHDFEAGFQAAIEVVKAGGVQAVIVHRSVCNDLDWSRDGWQPANGFTDLYKLPEDV